MARYQNDSMLDAALDWIRARITIMTACNAQPTTYTQATSTYKLADIAMTSTDLTLANGDVSGRKVTVGAKSGVTIDVTGTANHVALAGSTGATILLYVTVCSSQSLTTGNTVNFPAWDIEIADASS